MLRNRTLGYMFLVFILLLLAGLILAAAFKPAAWWIMAADMVFMGLVFFIFTWLRYKRIKALALQIHQFQRSVGTLELEKYSEGELSYLSSEIGKMAVKLTEQAEMLDRDKNYLADAISNISHQLKTPLTSMSMMTEFLRSGNLTEEKREEFTQNIRTQLLRIEWLVSALLKMARLDAKAVLMKQEAVQVSDMLRKASAHLLIPMELKGQELKIDCPPEIIFYGDSDWMSEAVSNILKNCMEHMDSGKTLHVNVTDNPLYVRVEIRDEGCGIAPEELPHIFERFYKGQNASPDSVGIGLAMAKQIIHQQNGVIQVESTLGEGTLFIIKLYK